MSFETNKRKVDIIRNRQIDQQAKANNQSLENDVITRDIKKLSSNHSVFKKHTDLSIDWNLMTQASFFEEIDPDTQFIDWEIALERFDERLLPFINIEIIYQVSDGSFNDGADIETPSKIILFEIEDLPNEEFIKKVIIRASFYFSDGDIFLPYQAKLLVTITPHQNI